MCIDEQTPRQTEATWHGGSQIKHASLCQSSDASYMFPKAPLISSQAKNLGAESAAGGIQVWEQKTGS